MTKFYYANLAPILFMNQDFFDAPVRFNIQPVVPEDLRKTRKINLDQLCVYLECLDLI